ncbi:hypothetical protein TrVFT333_001918 [Trichoderma virens FT-333]|nr:hypothetical protein TrVFT333_001918 [Trichoderma virens FT-333]
MRESIESAHLVKVDRATRGPLPRIAAEDRAMWESVHPGAPRRAGEAKPLGQKATGVCFNPTTAPRQRQENSARQGAKASRRQSPAQVGAHYYEYVQASVRRPGGSSRQWHSRALQPSRKRRWTSASVLKAAEAPIGPNARGQRPSTRRSISPVPVPLCSTAANKDAVRGHALFPLPTIPEFLTTPDVGKHPAFKSPSPTIRIKALARCAARALSLLCRLAASRLWSRVPASRDIPSPSPSPRLSGLTLSDALCRLPRSRRTASLVLCAVVPIRNARPTEKEAQEEEEKTTRSTQSEQGPSDRSVFVCPISKRHIAAARIPQLPTQVTSSHDRSGQVPTTPSPSIPNLIPFTQGTVAALTILDQPETPELSLQQHLDLAPDLVGYGSQLVTGDDPQSLMMAQPVPHQDKKRVKVYELRNNDWFDRGTGFCTAKFATTEDGGKDPKVIVESEDQPERLLLETTIQKQDGFQKQQGKLATAPYFPFQTLIVWQEPGSGVDMALSFQEAEGCAMIWRFVNSVQQQFQQNAGVDDNLSDDLAIEAIPPVNLPTAELGNLVEIETSIRVMSATATGREAVTKFIVADDYISKLIPLVEIAEDLESLPDLHRLCNIMKGILLLNDTSIIEHAVSDECLLGVVGALEYDPDFPSHKANHRHWLSNQGHYKEVVPINDDAVRRKIHQTYRLQYLKDVVLARILDDPTFSVLSSLIFFNQVEIVQHLQTNPTFLMNLFGIFSAHYPDTRKRKEAVLFIQQCCAIAKTIQAPARQSLYINFLNHGLLRVIYYGLRHVDVAVRVGATDILISIIDHDPTLIRQTIFRQMHEGTSSLLDSLIDLLLVEVDLGVKTQISDALRVILDQGGGPAAANEAAANNNANANGNKQQAAELAARARMQMPVDPQHEHFLTRFYESSALKLFRPLIELDTRSHLDFTVQEAAMFSCLVEVLGFFIRQHHRFSRYFFIVHNLAARIVQLLKCRDKYLQLVSIRFFRLIVGLQEELYVKNLIENDVLGPILEVLVETVPRDNLVSAACTELFDFVKKEYLRDMVKNLVADHRENLLLVCHIPPCQDLITRYDQTEGYTTNMDYFVDTDDDVTRRPPHLRMMEHLPIDLREEEYWDASDPEDEGEDQNLGDRSSRSGGSSSGKPLVDYPSDEDDAEDGLDNDTDDQSREEGDESLNFSPRSNVSANVPPPERLSEKRRREEDEDDDDELGKLMQSKRRNSNSTESNSSIAPNLNRRRKSSFTNGGGNVAPRKIAISLSPALRSGGPSRSDDDS